MSRGIVEPVSLRGVSGYRPWKMSASCRVGIGGLGVVLGLFLANELALIFASPSAMYVLGRVVIIPAVGVIAVSSTVYQMVRGRVRGRGVLIAMATMLCVAGIVAFQFAASDPVVRYLGIDCRSSNTLG